MTTGAAFIEESRMKFADPTKLDRKSGAVDDVCGTSFHVTGFLHSRAVLCSRVHSSLGRDDA
jgi:hypothetical protein